MVAVSRTSQTAELVRKKLAVIDSRAIEAQFSPEFDRADSASEIMADLNVLTAERRPAAAPAGLPAYVAALYEVPLLTPAEEAHLFRQYNYLKYRALQLRRALPTRRVSLTAVIEIEELLERAATVRERIIRSNLRLVVANARKFCDGDHLFDDLVSDGNLSLLQAIEKFDYSRGFRFSTYATHAIRRSFYRRMARKSREKSRLAFTGPELLQEVAQPVDEAAVDPAEGLLFRRLLQRMSDFLSERELEILRARFSLETGEETRTLQSIARSLGICKERVRQLQNRAVEKLREVADEMRSEFDADSITIDDVVLAPAS